MANEVPKDSPAAAIIGEEERLFGQVSARVALGDEPETEPSLAGSDIENAEAPIRLAPVGAERTTGARTHPR